MNKRMGLRKTQKGFSLIELMIAMLLGLILIAGVINIFLSSNQTYRLQDALFRIQETSRFALEVIKTDLRAAGFDEFLQTYGVLKNLNQRSVFGIEQGAADTPEIAALVVAGRTSDAMLVDLSETPAANVAVYYVAPDAAAGGKLALFRNNAAIAENVEGLNIQYGIDTDNDRFPNNFADASAVNAAVWSSGSVVAVRMNILLAAGGNGLVESPVAMPVPFNNVDVSDGRLYRMFSTTVALRNKVP